MINHETSNSPVNTGHSLENKGRTGIELFINTVKPYWELASILVALVGGFYFVRDYFATKEEVEILKCEARNRMALIESLMRVQEYAKERFEIEKKLQYFSKIDLKTSLQQQPVMSDEKIGLLMKKESLDRLLYSEHEAQKKAKESLEPGGCEKSVKK